MNRCSYITAHHSRFSSKLYNQQRSNVKPTPEWLQSHYKFSQAPVHIWSYDEAIMGSNRQRRSLSISGIHQKTKVTWVALLLEPG